MPILATFLVSAIKAATDLTSGNTANKEIYNRKLKNNLERVLKYHLISAILFLKENK